LITILLFFQIPAVLATDEFDPGILLFMIITTNIIMTISLIQTGLEIKPVLTDRQPSGGQEKKQNGKQQGDKSGKTNGNGNNSNGDKPAGGSNTKDLI